MKRIFLFLATIAIVITSCNVKSPQELSEKFSQHQKNHNLIHASWTFRAKGAMSKDTFSIHAQLWAQRTANDTNWYGNIMAKFRNTTGFYINGEGMEYDSAHNQLVIYPKKYARYAVSGYGNEFIKYYLNPDKLNELITDPQNKAQLIDTIIDGTKMKAVKLELPDDGDLTNRSQIIFFDKNYNIKRIDTKGYMIWGWTWRSSDIDKIDFKLPQNFIEQTLEQIKKSAKIDTMKLSGDQQQDQLLQKGTLAPEIYGTNYATGDTFLLSQQKAKVYVIDFWYQTCSPCMRAIPYLVDLYNKNKDKGLLVIGVNSVDNNPRRRPYLKKFIEHKKINYPIVLTVRKVDMSYKVPGYPTIYVLDKDRNIIFYEVGFDPEEKLHAVDSVVTSLLNK